MRPQYLRYISLLAHGKVLQVAMRHLTAATVTGAQNQNTLRFTHTNSQMILMMQNFGSHPNTHCRIITDDVMTMGFLYLSRNAFIFLSRKIEPPRESQKTSYTDRKCA
jgi:hypothetical protein